MLRTVNSASLAHCFQAVESLSGYTFHPIWSSVVRVCALTWVPSILFCALSFLCSLSMASMKLSVLLEHSEYDDLGSCSCPAFPLVRYWVSSLTAPALLQNQPALAQITRNLGTRKDVLVADNGFKRSHSKKQAMAY